MMLNADEVKKELIDECKIFHFGSLSLTDEPCRKATYDAVNYAKEEISELYKKRNSDIF